MVVFFHLFNTHYFYANKNLLMMSKNVAGKYSIIHYAQSYIEMSWSQKHLLGCSCFHPIAIIKRN